MNISLDMKKLVHSGIAIMILVGALVLLKVVGSALFSGLSEGLEHLVQMVVFAGVAMVVITTNLYIMLFTPLQAVILPYSDFLQAHEKRWDAAINGDADEPSQAECHTALGYNINSGVRILAVLIAQALVATPL